VLAQTGTASAPTLGFSGWVGTGIYTPTGTSLGFSTSGVERMRLDISGNLGLGGAPNAGWANSTVLQTNGTFSAISTDTASDGNLSLSWNAYATAADTWFYRNTGIAANRYAILQGAFRWYTAPSGTAGNAISFTQAMTLDASGRLGIGVTNPNAKLEVYDGTTGEMRVTNLTNGFQIYTDASATTMGTFTNAPLVIRTNSTERARIDTSGNLIQSTPTTPPSLATNGTMVFNLTSNTNLRVSVRGSDGVTRTANITLA
jgi:hypothetical protein